MNEEIRKIEEKYGIRRQELENRLKEEYGVNKLNKEISNLQKILEPIKPDPGKLIIRWDNQNLRDIRRDFGIYGEMARPITNRKLNTVKIAFTDPRDAQDAKTGLSNQYTFL